MPGNKHGPNRFTNYVETHDAIMGQFVDKGFILTNSLVFNPVGGGLITLIGEVTCVGNIEIDVSKILQIVEGEGSTATVQTVDYRYNVKLTGIGNIVRYDSPHANHNQFHHAHRYDVLNGDGEGKLEQCDWPTLGDVLAELEAWFYENYDRLETAE